MRITDAAREHLRILSRRVGQESVCFRFDGVVGTCRASVPLLKPAASPAEGEFEIVVDDVRIFVPEDQREMMESATLDYDASPLFGRGLNLTWPHGVRGCPACGGG